MRVVVMRGAGRAFCAGLDIKDRSEGGHTAVPFGGGFGFQGYLADVYVKMRRCPQPIVALVHGAACGGGFDVAELITHAEPSAALNIDVFAREWGIGAHLIGGACEASELDAKRAIRQATELAVVV